MSEFQYYEWQTLDRTLTTEERKAVNALSSHIHVTSTGAQVDYSWGSFKHDPIQVLARYFDAFVYASNWGTSRLAFRFEADLLPEAALQPYILEDVVKLTPVGDVRVLEISFDEEEGADWVDEPDLATLAALRAELLAGDYRMLYLAWLLDTEALDDEEALEPPVPPGLANLSKPLQAFVEFFDMDPLLVQAAAQAGGPLHAAPEAALDTLIAQLPRAECDDYLRRLIHGEAQLALKLKRRLHELRGQASTPAATVAAPPTRTLGDLRKAAKVLQARADAQKRATDAERRVQELEAFAPHAEQAWAEIDALMEKKTAPAYAEAVARLVQLRDLAVLQNDPFAFTAHFSEVRTRYGGRSAFQSRLQAAGLLDPLL